MNADIEAQEVQKIGESRYGNDIVVYFVDSCSSSHPKILSPGWDGLHSIRIDSGNVLRVSYKKYEKLDEYYFFKAASFVNRYIAFDENSFRELMFGNLNHEQREAQRFIEFINETFESMSIVNRYSLSGLFKQVLEGKFGEVKFFSKFDLTLVDNADAEILTKKGVFKCAAYFDGFAYQGVMNEIIRKNLKIS